MDDLKDDADYQPNRARFEAERAARIAEANARKNRRPTIVRVGLDLGKSVDFTALVVAEEERRDSEHGGRVSHFVARSIERLPLGTSYPRVADRIHDVMHGLMAMAKERRAETGAGFRTELIVDATGLGAPVIDLLRERGLRPIPVTLAGGERLVVHEDGRIVVGKAHLIGQLQMLSQTRRLYLPDLPEAEILAEELDAFEPAISAAGNTTFNAPSGKHDDLLIACGLACLQIPGLHKRTSIVMTGRAKGVW